jgi:hypothetical protein
VLLKVFKGKYFLCLVSLHPQNPQHCLVDWDELKKCVQHKRVQYQINLARRLRAHSPGARPANTARTENRWRRSRTRVLSRPVSQHLRAGLLAGIRCADSRWCAPRDAVEGV